MGRLYNFARMSPLINMWVYAYRYHIKKPTVPKDIQIESTNACKFKCKMCYHQAMKRKKGFMKFDMYKQIVDEASKAGVTGIRPQFAGEALLHPRIVDMIEYAKEKGMRVWLATTGGLLTPKLSEKLIKSGVDTIGFSFHGGTREDYKTVHGVDYFDKCQKNIKEFYEIRKSLAMKKPLIGVGVMINKDSWRTVYKVPNLLERYCDVLNFETCTYHPMTMPNDCRLIKYDVHRTYPCLGLFGKLTILWDGTITLCCIDNEGFLKVGHVDDGVINAFNSPKMKQYRKWHLKGEYHKMPLCNFCAGPIVEERYISKKRMKKIIKGDV